jgi:hypothetical protein
VREKAQIVICVSRPKSASFSSESGFSSRGSKTGENHFLAEVHINFFTHQHDLQSKKTSLEKLQIYFVSTFFE